jgi:hypothetical protein
MRITRPLAAAIGLSMVASPVLAQAAAPLSLAPIGAGMEQSSGLSGDSYILPAVIIFGVLAAAILISNDNNRPTSP